MFDVDIPTTLAHFAIQQWKSYGGGKARNKCVGQELLCLKELPCKLGVWKMTVEGQVRWQSGHVLGQGT